MAICEHGVLRGEPCGQCEALRRLGALERKALQPVQLSAEELADVVEAKLTLIAAIVERRGLLERRGSLLVDEEPRARVVTTDPAASNEDLEADLKFIRAQIDRSLELLGRIREHAKEPTR